MGRPVANDGIRMTRSGRLSFLAKGADLPRGRGRKTEFGTKWRALEIACSHSYREAGELTGLHPDTVRKALKEVFRTYFRALKKMDLENTRKEETGY